MNDSVRQRMKSIYINDFDGVSIYELLFYFNISEEVLSVGHIVKSVMMVLISRFFYQNKFVIFGNPHTLFLLSNEYANRADHKKYFSDVLKLSDNYLFMEGQSKSLKRVKFRAPSLKLLFKWNQELKGIYKNFAVRIKLLSKLYCIYSDYSEYLEYSKQNGLEIDRMVSYCDAMPVDYYFTSCFNKKKLLTVTLQHGVCNLYNKNMLVHSHSKVFFAANKSIDELMKKIGHDCYLEIVGMPSWISSCEGSSVSINTHFDSNSTIGVFLDGKILYDENVKLLEIVNKFATSICGKVIVRFHITSPHIDYVDLINKNVEVCNPNITYDSFLEMIDMAITQYSTVTMQLLVSYFPLMVYRRSDSFKVYESDNKHICFDSLPSLLELYGKYLNNSIQNEYNKFRKCFIPDGCISSLFRMALEKYDLV